MNFHNLNPLNVRLNLISGNLLPMTSDNTLFPIAWKIYSIALWFVVLLQTSGAILALILMPKNKSLQNGGTIYIVVSFEVLILLARMYIHRNLVRQLIQKFNNILHSTDKTMKSIVQSILKPLKTPLEIYWIIGVASIMIWSAMPLALLFKKKYFFYEDFGILVVFSKEPFSRKIFLSGSFIIAVAGTYVFTKKVALDVYMINLVLLMTAQYRYTAIKLATIFRRDTLHNEHSGSQKMYYSNLDILAVREIKVLCRHHSAVIQMMIILKKLLSANMSLIYFINVFRFCFLDVLIINAILSAATVEGFMLFAYLCGNLVQLYILCFCVQQLLDASMKITNEAFNEKWYKFAPSLKCTFMLMIVSDNLKCELSMFGKFNLSLSSFMMILNQSYSVALLLLKIK